MFAWDLLWVTLIMADKSTTFEYRRKIFKKIIVINGIDQIVSDVAKGKICPPLVDKWSWRQLKVQATVNFSSKSINFVLNENLLMQVSLHEDDPPQQDGDLKPNNRHQNGSFLNNFNVPFAAFVKNKKLVICCQSELSWYDSIPGQAGIGKNDDQISANEATIVSKFKKLSYMEAFPDVKFVCQTEEIFGNKLVLSAWSPVFRAMFKDNKMLEAKTSKIIIDDFDAAVVTLFLDYLHGTEVPEAAFVEHAAIIFQLAHKYQIEDLLSRCEIVIVDSISMENFADILIMSDKYGNEAIKKAVHDFVTTNKKEVVETGAWKKFLKENPHLAVDIFVRIT